MSQIRYLLSPTSPEMPLAPIPAEREEAATWAGRRTFERAHDLAAEHHVRYINLEPERRRSEASGELATRLAQLDFLLKSCYSLSHRFMAQAGIWGESGFSLDTYTYLRFVLETQTEAFYYLAHRAQKLLLNQNRKGDRRPPRLRYVRGYKVAKGVQRIRNHFIEHPEHEDWNGLGWTYSSLHGPAVRSGRLFSKPKPPGDLGLFPDAEELISAAESVLEGALALMDSEGVPPAPLSSTWEQTK